MGRAAPLDLNALTDLPRADIVIVGEVHDNPAHHRVQAAIITALAPRAVVFEMLPVGRHLSVTPAEWAATGFPDFDLYAPIFEALGSAAIYGAALPPGTVREAVSVGAAAQFGPDAARYGLDQPLDDAQQTLRIAGQKAAHCDAMPTQLLPGMVEAQRLRDAAFGRAVLAAHAEHGGPVILIAGNGHARRDWGVPRYLERASALSVLVIGQLERSADAAPTVWAQDDPDRPPYDLWVTSAPLDRPDPCLAFR